MNCYVVCYKLSVINYYIDLDTLMPLERFLYYIDEELAVVYY